MKGEAREAHLVKREAGTNLSASGVEVDEFTGCVWPEWDPGCGINEAAPDPHIENEAAR